GATFGPATGATEAPTRGGTATSFTGLEGTGGAPLKVGSAFGPRYQITSLLGIGGMGAVYKAWDAELGVDVALKVIRSDERRRASPETEKQFKKELLLARQVTHKNVVRIHDLGEIDGVKYITMPYVEGDNLATVLRRDGKLPLPRALRLAREIAEALCAAHEAGVIHRDLKPANIMISGADDEAHALIMDFGISASVSDAETGSVFGTLDYMAPEQGCGEKVDGRADIYAFGLILYEMFLGIRATPPDRYEAMMQRFEHGLPAVRTIDESIPEPVNAIVMRCLERTPDARFQTSAEVSAALGRLDDAGEVIPEPRRLTRHHLIAASIIMALIAGGASYLTSRAIQPPARHDPMPLLIADFDNLAHDPEFSGSLEQALGVAVEQASFITAYPRREADAVAAQLKPGAARLDENLARLVALRAGVKVVLAGSIAPQGAGYRVTVKAVDPQGQVLTTVASDARSKSEVLDAVGIVGTRIRRALGDTTPQGQPDTETLTAASLEAVQHYSAGRDLDVKYRIEDALEQYKRATELDPNFGRAYAGWANDAFLLGRGEESQAAWKKALALVDRMTEREKYRTLGVYYGTASRNYEKAIENFETLTRLYPADGAGHNNLAMAYFSTLDFQKALQEGRRVREIYPNLMLYRGNYALFAMYASDFASASDEASRIVADDPKYYPAYLPLAVAAGIRNDFAGARDAYDRMATFGDAAASTAAIGLADLALYQRHAADAIALMTRAVATDTTHADTAGVAADYVLLAEAYEAAGRRTDARRAALAALKASQDLEAALAARVLLRVGAEREAAAVAAMFGGQLQPQKRAYGKVIEGEIALNHNRFVDAVEAFSTARKLADLWIVRFDLGVAYIQAGQYAEAFSELDLARRRQGEATALLLDDRPTLRYLAVLPYWLARAQEQLGQTTAAARNYSAFLALRSDAPNDPLAVDAARRVKSAR
ncbi:MAG TPA: protein kinase, partial [Vicinamibacterales bacterium]